MQQKDISSSRDPAEQKLKPKEEEPLRCVRISLSNLEQLVQEIAR